MSVLAKVATWKRHCGGRSTDCYACLLAACSVPDLVVGSHSLSVLKVRTVRADDHRAAAAGHAAELWYTVHVRCLAAAWSRCLPHVLVCWQTVDYVFSLRVSGQRVGGRAAIVVTTTTEGLALMAVRLCA